MNDERDAEILALIGRLSSELKLAEKYSLDVTTRLLKTAILDLRTLVFLISDDELRSFSDALEDTSQFSESSVSRIQ